MAHAHRLGGQGFQPSRWSQVMVRLWGMATPDGRGSQAGGTRSPAQPRARLWDDHQHVPD